MTKEIIKSEESLPKHIAIIMDGNGRWAKQHHLPRAAGHKKGLDATRATIEFSIKHKISQLTLFAFSSENWNRPREEVRLLTELLFTTLENEALQLHENGIRLRVIGDLTPFGEKIDRTVRELQELTQGNMNLNLTVAVNYGGRWDIVEAARKIKELDRQTKVDEDLVSSFTSLSNFSDPDLCIRTGGDYRLSNFLLWHLAYSELYFSDFLWPDFDDKQFKLALKEYSERNRRFGKESNF